ncbi:hypothetical protein [Streptomyces sp. CA-106110]|uniref:hypothetical protein n=1 Tax=Streptomyces sp. CA-106110 TaxID=3240044 RepID=UPI003D8F21C0
MAVDRLPGGVREFADYLNALLTRLDQGGGWCGVFWQRDPEGMRACLDGREVPPWDVVEALLHDLGAAYGPEAATGEAERARTLHGASLAAYDARPGGRDALGHRLDVMLREQRRAADRQADLGRRLETAATREEADSLRLDLAWAHDDHERATARCAELRRRMEALDHRAMRPLAEGAGDFRAAAAGDGGWAGETGGGREGYGDRGASGPPSPGAGDFRAPGPVDGEWPGETASTAVRGTDRDGEASGQGAEGHPVGGGGWPEGRDASGVPVGGPGWPEGRGASGPDGAGGGPSGAGAEWPEVRRVDPARARSARWPEGRDASGVPVGGPGWPEGPGASGPDGTGGGPGGAGAEWPGEARRVEPARLRSVGWAEGRDASGVPVGDAGWPEGRAGSGPDAARGDPGDARTEWPEAHRVAPARWPEGRDASGVPVSEPGRPAGSDAGSPGAGAQAPSVEARREPSRVEGTAADGGSATAGPWAGGGDAGGGFVWPDGRPGPEGHGFGSRADARPPADSAAPHLPVAEEPHPAAGQSEAPVKQRARRRPRGSARFAGVMDVQEASAGTASAPAPATSRRGPRGARFAGATAAGPPADTPSRRDVPDETDRRLTAETVAALTRLRAEGRSGEAHALLVEAAHWPPARYPLLADELHRAGLHADWTTLLWEAASLSVAGLVAAADALTSAGRSADGEQMLRQGVVRPAGEIGEAVLGLSEERRHREVRALLDVYVRARTPEEAARSAAPDPQRLVPLLLEAARGVSDQRHWDLVHALRVAGHTA